MLVAIATSVLQTHSSIADSTHNEVKSIDLNRCADNSFLAEKGSSISRICTTRTRHFENELIRLEYKDGTIENWTIVGEAVRGNFRGGFWSNLELQNLADPAPRATIVAKATSYQGKETQLAQIEGVTTANHYFRGLRFHDTEDAAAFANVGLLDISKVFADVDYDLCAHQTSQVMIHFLPAKNVDWDVHVSSTSPHSECAYKVGTKDGHPWLDLKMIGYDGVCRVNISLSNGAKATVGITNNYALHGGCNP